MARDRGFTLIELVAVLVIAGVLGVICVAEFVNLRSAAANAVASEIGTQIASATSMNYSRGAANGAATTIAGVTACQSASGLAALPPDYAVLQGAPPSGSGQLGECAIWNPSRSDSIPASFSIVGCADARCT
jgi:prepilin-type N-terminal cleavage/methylation domain-containing protein